MHFKLSMSYLHLSDSLKYKILKEHREVYVSR